MPTLVWPGNESICAKHHNETFTYPKATYELRKENEFRQCSYDGSIHPEDLYIGLTRKGWTLEGSDWKYGWPHKFYVRQNVEGQQYGNSVGKFYNEHLLEVKDIDTQLILFQVVETHSGIKFHVHPTKGLGYSAPYNGYQSLGKPAD
jgi:hypothetical protein